MLKLFPFGEGFDASMGGQVLGPDEPLFDLGPPHLLSELALNRQLLLGDHRYYFRGGPARLEVQWEVLELVLTDLARFRPDAFSLSVGGDRWAWHNGAPHEVCSFTFGDPASLPLEPLDWAGRQVQEDLVPMGAGSGTPCVGGQLCFADSWALDDRLGGSFAEIHTRTPQTTVPSVEAGERLLGMLRAGHTVWRSSRAFKLTHALDLTTRHEASDRADFAARTPGTTAQTVVTEVYIRIERQTFTRLRRSGMTLFGVHTDNSSLETEAADPERARRRLAVLRQTPDDVKAYKATTPIERPMLTCLESQFARVAQ